MALLSDVQVQPGTFGYAQKKDKTPVGKAELVSSQPGASTGAKMRAVR